MTDLSFTDPRVLRAIELIWREAALLDAKDYRTWEAMYADEAKYVIPIDSDTDDFDASLNMVNDDKRMRGLRVQRMMQGYSQSAVSSQIAQLEAELGTPLFDRVGKTVRLTDAGQTFLRYARTLLETAQQAQAA